MREFLGNKAVAGLTVNAAAIAVAGEWAALLQLLQAPVTILCADRTQRRMVPPWLHATFISRALISRESPPPGRSPSIGRPLPLVSPLPHTAPPSFSGAVSNNKCSMTNTKWVIDGALVTDTFGFKCDTSAAVHRGMHVSILVALRRDTASP